MIDVAVVAVLVWLLIVHGMLRVSHSKRKRALDALLNSLRGNATPDAGKPVEYIMEAKPYLLRLSGRADVSIAHTNHAMFISGVCVGTITLLALLRYWHGTPLAGWMSTLLLPAPACMLVLHSRDWFRWHAGGRRFDRLRGLAASVRQPVGVNSVVLAIPIILAVQVATQYAPNLDIRSADAADTGMSIGMFAVISGLIAIIAGGIVLRLLYVDREYRKLISTMDDARAYGAGRSGRAPRWRGGRLVGESAFNVQTTRPRPNASMERADVHGKKVSNGRGALVDGTCMTAICVVGFATALEYSPGLFVSAAVSFASFLCAVVPLHYHIRNALSPRQSYPL